MTAVPPIPRDRYNRPLVFPQGGGVKTKPYTRVTTLAGTLSDKFFLEQWKLRTCITGLVNRPDLFQLAATHLDDRKMLDHVASDAVEAGDVKKAAAHGTSLHRWCEMADRNELDVIPEVAPKRQIDAYRAGLQSHGIGIVPDLIERFCVNEHVEAAGTFDRIVEYNGRLVIADIKTGNFLNDLDIAIQLAVYANCTSLYEVLPDGTGKHHKPPEIDRDVALILHLPQNAEVPHLDVIEADIQAGWEAAFDAVKIRKLRSRKLTSRVSPALPVRDELMRRVEQITRYPAAMASLIAQWPPGVPTFKQTPLHSPDHYLAIVHLVSAIEAEHGLPF